MNENKGIISLLQSVLASLHRARAVVSLRTRILAQSKLAFVLGTFLFAAAQIPATPVTAQARKDHHRRVPVIITGSVTGEVNIPFTYQIRTKHHPTSYDASGLPEGLSVDTETGLISGIPKSTGTFNVTLMASNSAGKATADLALTITEQAQECGSGESDPHNECVGAVCTATVGCGTDACMADTDCPMTCVPDGSCIGPTPACEQRGEGLDNCGNKCTLIGPLCPPPPPPPEVTPLSVSLGANVVSAGGSVDIPVTFTSGATGVSAIQFDLMLPAGVKATKVSLGPAASEAGKSVSQSFIDGGVKVIVFGLNQNVMKTGVVALVTVSADSSTTKGPRVISATNIAASDASGVPVSVTGASGTLTIQ